MQRNGHEAKAEAVESGNYLPEVEGTVFDEIAKVCKVDFKGYMGCIGPTTTSAIATTTTTTTTTNTTTKSITYDIVLLLRLLLCTI